MSARVDSVNFYRHSLCFIACLVLGFLFYEAICDLQAFVSQVYWAEFYAAIGQPGTCTAFASKVSAYGLYIL